MWATAASHGRSQAIASRCRALRRAASCCNVLHRLQPSVRCSALHSAPVRAAPHSSPLSDDCGKPRSRSKARGESARYSPTKVDGGAASHSQAPSAHAAASGERADAHAPADPHVARSPMRGDIPLPEQLPAGDDEPVGGQPPRKPLPSPMRMPAAAAEAAASATEAAEGHARADAQNAQEDFASDLPVSMAVGEMARRSMRPDVGFKHELTQARLSPSPMASLSSGSEVRGCSPIALLCFESVPASRLAASVSAQALRWQVLSKRNSCKPKEYEKL